MAHQKYMSLQWRGRQTNLLAQANQSFSSTRDYWFTKLCRFNCGSNRQCFLSFCTRYWIQKYVLHLAGWQEISQITVATTTDSLFFMHVTIWTKWHTTSVAKYAIFWSVKSTRLGVISVTFQDMRLYGVTGKLFCFGMVDFSYSKK